jgi:RNA polymerase sigma-70 factor (ECF subfamily)
MDPCARYFHLTGPFAIGAVDLPDASDNSVLVRAAQAGDRAAFATLYERFARMVHGVLLARVPRHDVDDLAQDVFLVAMRRLSSLREPAAFGGWLAAIARNHATDFYRRRVETDELPENVAGSAGPHPDAIAVLDAIRTLPEAYRETLMLRLVEGMTGPEIAERTGLTPGSVRVNLHRGMKHLREKLAG